MQGRRKIHRFHCTISILNVLFSGDILVQGGLPNSGSMKIVRGELRDSSTDGYLATATSTTLQQLK